MSMKFKIQRRAGRTYVRGVVTVAEWDAGELGIMAPDRKTLRKLWNCLWPTRPVDMSKVKNYCVMKDTRKRK